MTDNDQKMRLSVCKLRISIEYS